MTGERPARASTALPIARRHKLRAFATFGLTTTIGNDYNTFGAAWQTVF